MGSSPQNKCVFVLDMKNLNKLFHFVIGNTEEWRQDWGIGGGSGRSRCGRRGVDREIERSGHRK